MVTVPVTLLMARLGRKEQSRGKRLGNRDRTSIGWAAGKGRRWAGKTPRETYRWVQPHPGALYLRAAGPAPRPCPALGLPLAARR